MAVKKDNIIILIDRNGFSLYSQDLGAVLQCPFPLELVKDLEIIDVEQFVTYIKNFIVANNISPAAVIFLLIDRVTFEKNIIAQTNPAPIAAQTIPAATPVNTPILSKDEEEKETKAFLDTIPFEHISSKSYPISNGVKIIAVNAQLYMQIMHAFEQNGSIMTAVVPISLISNQPLYEFTPEIIPQVLSQVEILKDQSLKEIFQEETSTPQNHPELMQINPISPTPKKTKYGNRLYALVGVFAFLFIIMGVMLYQNFTTPEETAKSKLPTNNFVNNKTLPGRQLPTVTPTTSAIQPAVAQTTNPQAVKVEIITTSTNNNQGLQLESKLSSTGFTNVIVNTQSGNSVGKTLILFKQNVSVQLRTKIDDIMKASSINYSTQETTEGSYDIAISLL